MTMQRGASGSQVRRLQERLRQVPDSLYGGSVDGQFGVGTEAAVRAFQRASGLPSTGIVDEPTWQRLFPPDIPPKPSLHGKPVAYRCLSLTASFETGESDPDCFCGITGDFDGMGLSFGVLQWNLGQGSLQPMLRTMLDRHQPMMQSIFGNHFGAFSAMLKGSREEQLKWARSVQDTRRFRVSEPWRGLLQAMGRTPECIALQVEQAQSTHQKALRLCREYGLRTERGAALMFDVLTQNGSINSAVQAQIQRDVAALPGGLSQNEQEVARMRIIAQRRAKVCRPQYIADVLARKLTIAEGRGVVHKINYDLEAQFGLGLRPIG